MFPFRLQVGFQIRKKKTRPKNSNRELENDRELENGDHPASRFEQLDPKNHGLL